MSYIKADVIFPKELLREIQKYVHGETIYIPSLEGERKKWGENSGSRKFLDQRNNEIRKNFSEGMTIYQLSDLFCLSPDSIKKIVYSKK